MHRQGDSKMVSFFRLGHLASAIALLAVNTGSLQAESMGERIGGEMKRIFQECQPAVVRVRASDNGCLRSGSGFFIDSAGTVYTHAGVVCRSGEVFIEHNGKTYPAQVAVSDDRSGVAILKTACQSPFIRVGDSESLATATPVIAIGFPMDREASPSLGMIAGRDRHEAGQYFSTSHLRANLPVSNGEAGAPVLNFNGEVIGILMARLRDASACHILPIRAAEKVRRDLARFGELRHAWVGVEVEDSETPTDGSTARVSGLSDAASSVLQPGDVVLSIGGFPVRSSEDVLDAAFYLTAGEQSAIRVVRSGRALDIIVNPQRHPSCGMPLQQVNAAPTR